MIVAIDRIRAAYSRAVRLGASHEEAVRTIAQAIGEDETTVREALSEEKAAA